MIAALVLAAALSDKPFVVSWMVNWGGDRDPSSHSHAFAELEEAIGVADQAPMCSAPKEPPCVLWINVRFVAPPKGLLTKHK